MSVCISTTTASIARMFSACAWGNRGRYMGRAQEVVSILRKAGAKLHSLGELTKQGQPRHPLFVPAHTQRRHFHGVGLAGKAAARGARTVP